MATRVRTRTLAHLDKLLAISALAAACHPVDPGYGVVDPIPDPALDAPPPTAIPPGPPGTPSTIPEATGGTTVPTTPPQPPPDLGYGVVDPMPPPADCTLFSRAIYAYATFEGGALHVTVSAQARYRETSLDARQPSVAHAVVTEASVTSQTWTLALMPEAPARSLTFVATGVCGGAPAKATVQVSWDRLEKDAPIRAQVIEEPN